MIYKRNQLPVTVLQDRKDLRKFDDDLVRYLSDQDENLGAVLENGLTFSENFDGVFVTFTSNAIADTEDTITHDLGKSPAVGNSHRFIVVKSDKGAVLYNGGTADSETTINLKSTVASTTFTIFVF